MDWVARTWDALVVIAEGDPVRTSDACSQLDAVHREFNRAVDVFGVDAEKQRLLREAQISRLGVDAEKQRLVLEAQINRLGADAEKQREVLGAQISRLEAEASTREASVRDLSACLASIKQELAETSNQRTELQAEMTRVREATAAVQARLNATSTECAALRADVTDLVAERAAFLSSVSWRLTAPLRRLAGALLTRS
jgi:chromosome segregation ATPase